MNHLASLSHQCSYIIVCAEKHEDGSPHLHACLKFRKKVDIRKERYFDVNGYHPNIQTTKNINASINYCKKDHDFIEEGNVNEKNNPELPTYIEGMSKIDWLTECFTLKVPYGYADAFWKAHTTSDFCTLETFDISNAQYIHDVRLCLMHEVPVGLRSLVIVGPSGCGKTTWAKLRCAKPALMVTHMDDLKNFKIGFHNSIIFDDMSFRHLDPVLQIPIVDRFDNRSLHCRYAVAQIPKGIQKLFTCNVEPFHLELPQITRRVNLINLY